MTLLNVHIEFFILHCLAHSVLVINIQFENYVSGVPGPGGGGRQYQTGTLAQCDQHHPTGRLQYCHQSLLTAVVKA